MAETDDLRQFMREMLTRFERVTRDQARMFESQSRMFESISSRLDEQTRALRAHTDELGESRAEFKAEFRAQRQALFQILDRLQNGGAQA